MSSFHELLLFFERKQLIFLLFPFSGILVFQAAILAYKQKVIISEMAPIQFLIYKIKASFVANSKPLQRFAQFLRVSPVLSVVFQSLNKLLMNYIFRCMYVSLSTGDTRKNCAKRCKGLEFATNEAFIL